MTALELISLANQVLFVGLFVATAWSALRRPTRAHLNTALLFGSVAGIVTISRAAGLLGFGDAPWLTSVLILVLSVAPLAMLRLVDDFSGTQRWVQVAGLVAYLGIALLALTMFATQPVIVELALLAWFGIVGGYAAFAFARESRRSRGITRRRTTAVAAGAILFIGAFVLLFAAALFLAAGEVSRALVQVAALGSVLSFFLGFAPPRWARRAWREPELRRFLERSIHFTGMADDRAAIMGLQDAAASAFGAGGAAVGVADHERGVMRYVNPEGGWMEVPQDAYLGGRAFEGQQRIVERDAGQADPEHADVYARSGARSVIAAPISAEDRRIGVLTVYADRAPVFIEDDLWLLELLADQSAILLETRALAGEAHELRAREGAARLKEEFLSAAAHDLRTPLTVVLGQAELLERRLERDPSAAVDAVGVGRMAREARRLADLVNELLDAQQLEQGGAVMQRVELDVREILRHIQERHAEQKPAFAVVLPDEPLLASVDRRRLEQVLDNLIENAVKYSPGAAAPEVRAWADGDEVRISVSDHGVGIPSAEREHIFERFYRASNVQGITDTGLGLGLFICRRIVEAHDGRIWVDETPGGGSTFTVSMPRDVSAPVGAETSADDEWSLSHAGEAVADA